MMRKTGIVMLLAPFWCMAQQTLPDTVLLPQVAVKASRSSLFLSNSVTALHDSSEGNPFGAKTISDLLEMKSAVFIKSNGSSGLATITSRGTEARHNAVLWHGFNLNSATLGLSDLSIIPVCVSDKAELIHGGSSAVNGNSTIGSAVLLDNSVPTFEKSNRTILNMEGGSFGNLHGSLSSTWNTRFMKSVTTLFYDGADNNFSYTNIAKHNKPEDTLEHAAYSGYGLVQDFAFKIKPGQVLSAGLWYQVSEREIPPLMMVPESFAEQSDSNLRVHAGYKMELGHSVITIKGAAFRDRQEYHDEKYNFHKYYNVNNYFGDAEWRYIAGEKLITSLGIGYNEAVADFIEYNSSRVRSLASLYGSVRYEFLKGWTSGLNLRQEFSNITSPPLSPYLTLDGNLFAEKLFLSIQAGRHFSLPSMNDLYWVPGGNPDLKPEYGWTESVSLILKNYEKLPELTATVFNSNIDNWIKWQPSSTGIYTAENLEEVHAWGIEILSGYKFSFKKFMAKVNCSYAYTRSVLSEDNGAEEEATNDKQLVYVPEHVFNLNMSLSYRTWSLHFTNSYVGKRYTTTDNVHFLEPYNVADLTAEKKFPGFILPSEIYFRISNLYDTNYQVMAWEPTPGRWYSAGIRVSFSINSKHRK